MTYVDTEGSAPAEAAPALGLRLQFLLSRDNSLRLAWQSERDFSLCRGCVLLKSQAICHHTIQVRAWISGRRAALGV